MANTYLLLYSGGKMPATEAEQKKVMDTWNSWFAKHDEAITDSGNPFTTKAKTIGTDGKVSDGAFAAATGYTRSTGVQQRRSVRSALHQTPTVSMGRRGRACRSQRTS